MSPQWAVMESGRCLSCYDPPCVEACPVHVDVHGFIRRVKTGDLRGASQVLRENLLFPNTCALVCSHLGLCEGAYCIKKLPSPSISALFNTLWLSSEKSSGLKK